MVAAAGNVDHDEVVAGHRAPLRRPARATPRPGACPPWPRRVPLRVVRTARTEQAHLVVGMRALDRHDDDRFALAVLNQVLGGGMSSRLFQEIREKRGLVYSVYSYRAAYLETGALAVYAGTAPEPGPRGARPHRRRARQAGRRTASPTGSWPWPRATSRARWPSAWRTRPAA